MIRNRQTISAILLFVFCSILFNYLFFIAYIQLQKENFRKNVLVLDLKEQAEIKEIDAALLYQNRNGISWHEHNKEVCINGVYFEVISVQKNNGKAKLLLINDKKENQMFSSFFSSEKKSQDLFLGLIKLIFSLKTEHSAGPDFSNYVTKKSDATFYGLNYVSHYFNEIIKPPCVIS